ncbi:O-methyltransferase family 2 [Colletotrichum tofieldiae]|uniref:O-methyltransferase family 2 n=1 Tax=Colletotrichum tofieldiae TaxID=708197 RepID=A0A161YKY9_9PEZI|nr:O-methyltransferase family 2 [Colletotrichum tofieldiae]
MSHLIEFPRAQAEDTLRVEQLSNDLFKISLTRRNKFAIFSEAIERLDAGQNEADLVLRNLETWCPETAVHFRRRTSEIILNTPFRLLCSSPTGIPFDGAFMVRQYLAVSYSWHNPTWSMTSSFGVWPIGERFAAAILAQRGHPREGVWIDQVCINQCDEGEKQQAVACMDVVYRSCRKLVVLLEDVELTEAEAEVCKRCDAFYPVYDFDKHTHNENEITYLISMFNKIVAARWWQRAWCFHEFVIAEPWTYKRHSYSHTTAFVMGVGNKSTIAVSWLTLQGILVAVKLRLDHKTPQGDQLDPLLVILQDHTSPLLDDHDRQAGAITASFIARFDAVAQKGCLLPGDRLSVYLNLIGLSLAYFRSTEPTADEACYLATMLSLAAGEKMSLITTKQEPLKINGKKSWLARSRAYADTTLSKFTLGGIKGIHSISTHKLEIDLVLFESPLRECTEAELATTYTIFPDIIKSAPLTLKVRMGQFPRFKSDKDLDPYRRRFLASIIAGGHNLARRLWAQIDQEIVQLDNKGLFVDFAPNEDLRLNATVFLDALAKNRPKDLDISYRVTDGAALALLTWITDPRSFYWASVLPQRISCTRDGEQALVTVVDFSEEFFKNRDNIRLAVPTDLLQKGSALTRAWFLVSVKNEQGIAAWKVMGNALLLGASDLTMELRKTKQSGQTGEAVMLQRRQVVIG